MKFFVSPFIVCRLSSVRPQNYNFSETTGLIVTKFHIQPPGPIGTKNYSNDLGHLTKIATMPIYGKNLKKSFPEPKNP